MSLKHFRLTEEEQRSFEFKLLRVIPTNDTQSIRTCLNILYKHGKTLNNDRLNIEFIAINKDEMIRAVLKKNCLLLIKILGDYFYYEDIVKNIRKGDILKLDILRYFASCSIILIEVILKNCIKEDDIILVKNIILILNEHPERYIQNPLSIKLIYKCIDYDRYNIMKSFLEYHNWTDLSHLIPYSVYWGNLEAVKILVEFNFFIGTRNWYFPDINKEEVTLRLRNITANNLKGLSVTLALATLLSRYKKPTFPIGFEHLIYQDQEIFNYLISIPGESERVLIEALKRNCKEGFNTIIRYVTDDKFLLNISLDNLVTLNNYIKKDLSEAINFS